MDHLRHQTNRLVLGLAKGYQYLQALACPIWLVLSTTRHRLLTSRDFIQGLHHLSACPLPWAPLGPWLLVRPPATHLPRSCTSCRPTSSPTPSCCTTTYHRTPRVALVSAASPAPCSPSLKPPNPPTATLHTGQTRPEKERVGSWAGYSLGRREHMEHISGSPVPFLEF